MSDTDILFSSTARGSPRWMAPELIFSDIPYMEDHAGIRRTKESDIYALGCSLWQVKIAISYEPVCGAHSFTLYVDIYPFNTISPYPRICGHDTCSGG